MEHQELGMCICAHFFCMSVNRHDIFECHLHIFLLLIANNNLAKF